MSLRTGPKPRVDRTGLWTSDVWGAAGSRVDVRVVWLDLNPGPDVEADLAARLLPSEADRVGRLRYPIDRRRATVRLVRRREIVANEIGLAPSAVVIGIQPGGRPYVQEPERSDLRLTTSSSGDVGVVAVGIGVEVGIDVEVAVDIPDVEGCLSWIATSEEARYVQSLPLQAQRQAVLDMWTAKEACLKATSEGLGGDMRAVRIVATGGGHDRRLVTRGHGPQWQLHRLRAPAAGMAVALVVPVSAEGV